MRMLNVVKKWALITIPIVLILWFFIANWSFIFKEKIAGEVMAAERVNSAVAVLTDPGAKINP